MYHEHPLCIWNNKSFSTEEKERERYIEAEREREREQVNGYLSLVLVGMCMTREFEHTRKMTF